MREKWKCVNEPKKSKLKLEMSECERKFVMVKNHNTSVCLELRTSILINHIVLALLETKETKN